MGKDRFFSITLSVEQSDLWIGWNGGSGAGKEDFASELQSWGRSELEGLRESLEGYISDHPPFLTTLESWNEDPFAPPLVQTLIRSSQNVHVGPMAAVAGGVAEALGKRLDEKYHFRELVIENGGDLWISIRSPLRVSVYAGLSSLSGKIGITIMPEHSPCGLACSSGTVGPSKSFGKADAAVVVCKSAPSADAWATALGNRIRYSSDLLPAVNEIWNAGRQETLGDDDKIMGILAILADRMAAVGTLPIGGL
jgi:hypothetical protein